MSRDLGKNLASVSSSLLIAENLSQVADEGQCEWHFSLFSPLGDGDIPISVPSTFFLLYSER